MMQHEAAQQARPPVTPGWKASAWYVGILSLGMVIVNAGYIWLASFLLHAWESNSQPGGSSGAAQQLLPFQVLMLLLLFLVFFLPSLLRGRVTRDVLSMTHLGVYACMIGGTVWIIGVQGHEERAVFGDEIGLGLLVNGMIAPWLWGITQVLASAGGAYLGGLIGSRFFPRRPVQGSVR